MKKKFTLFHNSRCSKSCATLALLEARTDIELEIVVYLRTPPSVQELDALLTQLGLEPQDIVRKSEDEYEALGLNQNPPQSRTKWLETLTQTPILIERPIISDGIRAVIGRPPEKVLELLDGR